MSERPKKTGTWKHLIPTLDGWAVVAALLAALLVRAGIVKHVPW